eukprot:gene15700-17943_t
MPEEFQFNPKVSEDFLESWLDFPVDENFSIIFNSFKMWMTWLIWTNKSMAGLDPGDTTIRARVTSQISVIGTAAGLFLVIAIAGFLVPPELKHEEDRIYLDIFGCLMFAASVSLIFYIGVALTAFYPLVESLRDDIAFDAFENYQLRVGGFEVYLFFVGMQFVTIALVVAAKILYSDIALYVMFGIMAVILSCVTYLSRQIFLALDPISSMHMGLSNDPEEHYRAELMSHFILRKIPNTITDECGEVFNKKTESKKLQVTRASMAKITPLEYVEPPVIAVSNLDGEAVPSGKKQQIEPVREEGAQGDKSNKLSDVTLWQSNKVTPVGDNDHLEMVDMEGQHEASRREKPTPSSDSQRAKLSASTKKDANIRSVSLKELFCGEAYVFKSFGLSSTDAVAAYHNITQAGCTSSEELLHYLDEHKQYR